MMTSAEDRTQEASLPAEVSLGIFRTMATIRAMEERIVRGLRSGELRMTYYPVTGQEAIPAAVCAHLRPDDHMVTTYRGMHDCIAKGVPLEEMVAEMCGRVTGTSKGKGGPMHLSDPSSGLMVTTGVVGGGLPIANGLALAASMAGTDRVTVVNFGDGATSIGGVHESANLAALWGLPVVLVCQHNQYGEHTRFADYTRTASLADRFATYGMHAETVDGNSVPDLYRVAGGAVARARAGAGPTFLECRTYRLDGHAFGTPTGYMDADELARARAGEPVERFRHWLAGPGGVDPATLTAIEEEAAAVVAAAVGAALDSPPPGAEELLTDVFSTLEAAPR